VAHVEKVFAQELVYRAHATKLQPVVAPELHASAVVSCDKIATSSVSSPVVNLARAVLPGIAAALTRPSALSTIS